MKFIGQETAGIICQWDSKSSQPDNTHVGISSKGEEEVKVLHTFEGSINIVQATVNTSQSLLGFIKEKDGVWSAHVVHLSGNREVWDLDSSRGIRLQFLADSSKNSRLLYFKHKTSIGIYKFASKENKEEVLESETMDTLCGPFHWAQWDPVIQCVYYLHYRQKAGVDEVEQKAPSQTPVLSCLQFHRDLPAETVLTIPLDVPEQSPVCSEPYRMDPLSLVVSDTSLDLRILSRSQGVVVICSQYISQLLAGVGNTEPSPSDKVDICYDVSLLHHGCILHCTVPNIRWDKASDTTLSFAFFDDNYLVVLAPGLFTHLLDVSQSHEPCHHILLDSQVPDDSGSLVPLVYSSKLVLYDQAHGNTLRLQLDDLKLMEAYHNTKDPTQLLAILHYFIYHKKSMDIARKLVLLIRNYSQDLCVPDVLQEYMIGYAYLCAEEGLKSDATPAMKWMPYTVPRKEPEIRMVSQGVSVLTSCRQLPNAAVMVLTPGQRISASQQDLWTRLWERLLTRVSDGERFKPRHVADRLMVSLKACQPDCLSRATTPMSPSSPVMGRMNLASCALKQKLLEYAEDPADRLPFLEKETASFNLLEHVSSVNMQEFSTHLLKSCHRMNPLVVHEIAAQYASAQLLTARQTCLMLVPPREEGKSGFQIIEEMSEEKRRELFSLLERYTYATDMLAFPRPEGFSSFFTFLGFSSMNYELFSQYVLRGVFHLNVDVMRKLMAVLDDSPENVHRKLELISLIPRSRARQLLSEWPHALSLSMRAREHAANILQGKQSKKVTKLPLTSSSLNSQGVAAFPSGERLSPLDTFLALLTAKVNISELDLGLLVEATVRAAEQAT